MIFCVRLNLLIQNVERQLHQILHQEQPLRLRLWKWETCCVADRVITHVKWEWEELAVLLNQGMIAVLWPSISWCFLP